MVVNGPSGAGKSTLMQILAGILEPSSGIIKFNDFPLPSLNIYDLKKHIGFSLSNNEIFQGTIIENIRMGRSEVTAENIIKAIEIVNFRTVHFLRFL